MMTRRLALLLLALPLPCAHAAPPKVLEVRTQKVGDTVYFHVRLAPAEQKPVEGVESPEEGILAEPRLISPDGKARHIYSVPPPAQVPSGDEKPKPDADAPPPGTLAFIGKTIETQDLKLLLMTPPERASRKNQKPAWTEDRFTIDLRKGKEVAIPASTDRKKGAARNDLEGVWAERQVAYFTNLRERVSDFGFPAFAAEATARRYSLTTADRNDRFREKVIMVTEYVPEVKDGRTHYRQVKVEKVVRVARDGQELDVNNGLKRLYNLTSGTTAITESLALQRMRSTTVKEGARTVDVSKVEGITVAEHPWQKMLAGKKPADEPLATLIPHDNYYLTFKNPGKLFELLDQWGNGLGAFTAGNRDHHLNERYTEQLCLRRDELGRRAGGLLVRGVAVTGSDPYLREGSDVTVIFHVNRKAVFLAGLDRFIDEAKRKHGDALTQSKSTYHDIAIESHVTPLREVSLHRCSVADYVIYSNSPAGIRRVLDAHKGKLKRLSESQDFQYMRTVFRADDNSESGFLFLSDAFIRQVVGPVSKIKEKRRLEALTSLYMLTHGAMFNAWEGGKVPGTHKGILAGANLKEEEVAMPEGKPATWDAARQTAISDAYNTIHFATPLIELPMNKVSDAEVEQYRQFRLEYLGLWRQYFDPIGMRFSMTDTQVKVDTYILPLIENSGYNALKRVTGGGTFGLDPANISSKTLVQFLMHLSPNVQERKTWFDDEARGDGLDLAGILIGTLGPVGNWAFLRLDDNPAFSQLLDLAQRAERGEDVDSDELMRLAYSMPVVFGVDIKNALTFGAVLAAMRTAVLASLPGGVTWGPLEKEYKGVPIVRVQASAAVTAQLLGTDGKKGRQRFQPALYYAMIDNGFYLTLNEKVLHSLVDQMEARKKGDSKLIPVNSSLYLSPGAAKDAAPLLRLGVEMRLRKQAQANLPLWETLYRCGLIDDKTDTAKAKDIARKYLGFVPVSPDGSPYRYDASKDEVVNERHGSLRQPSTHKEPQPGSTLPGLVERLQSIRADLRFREDGIHTVVTLERKPKK